MSEDMKEYQSTFSAVFELVLLLALFVCGGALLVVGASGCKLHAYGDSSGDTSGDVNTADDGSTINANDVAVGGDVVANGGGVGVDASNRPVTSEGEPEDSEVDGRKVVCSDFRFPDGADAGNLIKPESDSSGNLAILFAEELVQFDDSGEPVPFKAVTVFIKPNEGSEDGVTPREELVFIGFETTEDGLIQNLRQKWEASMPGEAYVGRIEIVVGNGKVCAVSLDSDLGTRID